MHPIQINLDCRLMQTYSVKYNVRRPQARDVTLGIFSYRTNKPEFRWPLMLSVEAHNTTESVELKLLRQ